MRQGRRVMARAGRKAVAEDMAFWIAGHDRAGQDGTEKSGAMQRARQGTAH